MGLIWVGVLVGGLGRKGGKLFGLTIGLVVGGLADVAPLPGFLAAGDEFGEGVVCCCRAGEGEERDDEGLHLGDDDRITALSETWYGTERAS